MLLLDQEGEQDLGGQAHRELRRAVPRRLPRAAPGGHHRLAGRRLPVPLFPGFDPLGPLAHLRTTGHDHSWFVTTKQIVEKEFALSGSEQNPDLTGTSIRKVLSRARAGIAGPVQAFLDSGPDFVVRSDLRSLVEGMNALTPHAPVELATVEPGCLFSGRIAGRAVAAALS